MRIQVERLVNEEKKTPDFHDILLMLKRMQAGSTANNRVSTTEQEDLGTPKIVIGCFHCTLARCYFEMCAEGMLHEVIPRTYFYSS